MTGPFFERPTKGKIIVFGILFWYPLAGVTFQFLHYLIGLRRLGYDVYYVEDSGRWVYDPQINDITGDASRNIAAVAPVLEAHGFADRWAFRGNYPGGRCYGLTESELTQLYKDADAFLNVTAAQELRDEHMAVPRRIYVESDPFPAQVKAAQGDRDMLETLAAHDVHFTFGESVGTPMCELPATDVQWLPTRQPVVLDLWEPRLPSPDTRYRTITTWHNKNKALSWGGETYHWTKDREFLQVLEVPAQAGVPYEVAVDIDCETKQTLSGHQWKTTSSLRLSADVSHYRCFIEGSRGEFTVARDQYVRPRTGWFSDRSACFLAAGRPVVTQDTGFGEHLPTGKGLFSFSSPAEAVDALTRIEWDYEIHADAAREIANEYFDAEVVLASLMRRAGL
jgi:hypothetical protein